MPRHATAARHPEGKSVAALVPSLAQSRRLCRRAAARLVAGQCPAGGGRRARNWRWIADDPAAFVAMLDDREAKGGPDHPARRLAGAAPAGLPALDVGRRILRLDRLSLAARHVGPAALLPGPYRLQRRAVEAAAAATPRGRWRCCCRRRARRASTYVELTTDPDNLPSQKVITANGGVLVKRFRKEPAYGEAEALLFRIPL